MIKKLLKIQEVLELLDVKSKQTVYNYIKQKGFPAPIKITSRSSRWVEQDVQDWIDTMMEE